MGWKSHWKKSGAKRKLDTIFTGNGRIGEQVWHWHLYRNRIIEELLFLEDKEAKVRRWPLPSLNSNSYLLLGECSLCIPWILKLEAIYFSEKPVIFHFHLCENLIHSIRSLYRVSWEYENWVERWSRFLYYAASITEPTADYRLSSQHKPISAKESFFFSKALPVHSGPSFLFSSVINFQRR
jgi:hypothetical protein